MLGVLVVLGVAELLRKRTIPSRIMRLTEVKQLRYCEFIRLVQFLVDDILAVADSQKCNFKETTLYAFLYEHSNKCRLPHCNLFTESVSTPLLRPRRNYRI